MSDINIDQLQESSTLSSNQSQITPTIAINKTDSKFPIYLTVTILTVIAIVTTAIITMIKFRQNISNQSVDIVTDAINITIDVNIDSPNTIDSFATSSSILNNQPQQTPGLTIVPTMKDTITADSSWCGTFQLVWNDMKKEVVKGDIIFKPQQEKVAANLNQEEFNVNMLSEESYFKTYGLKTLALKEEIEIAIKEKFNQTSDILEDFDWNNENLNNSDNPDIDRYFFYVMLYKKFEYLEKFSILENSSFGKRYSNVEYFDIDRDSESARDQIQVLYYSSKDDFAITISTKTNDEIILCKNPQGDTFQAIYNNINDKTNKYTGDRRLTESDQFKAPNIIFNEKKEYTELAIKPFNTQKGEGIIAKAIQTIQFSLNEEGGEIKSEAAVDMLVPGSTDNIWLVRYFYIDDTFAIFLREKDQTMPYFAGRIEDITKFQ